MDDDRAVRRVEGSGGIAAVVVAVSNSNNCGCCDERVGSSLSIGARHQL